MQAVLANSVIKDTKSELCSLFENLETADNTAKSLIENKVVSFGEDAVDFLIGKLTASRGVQRGVAAMSLIRIGGIAVQSLKKLSDADKNYTWVANYIIKEIEGTF